MKPPKKNKPVEVKVGDLFADNDPRMPGRVIRVVSVGACSVVADDLRGGPRTTVLLRRMFDDGKPRRSGFSKVSS